MESDLLEKIVSELSLIKWLLLAILLVGLYFVLLLARLVSRLSRKSETFIKGLKDRQRQTELARLLGKGDYLAVKFAATEWLANEPHEPYAHWYSAKAYYQLGELLEAKKALRDLLQIAPEWYRVVEPWLEQIESEIPPKVVK